MDALKSPIPLSWEGNVAENWKRWYQSVTIFFTASGISAKTDEVKIATLLHVGGEQLVSVYNSFKWDEQGDAEGDDNKFDKVVAKFKKYCEPRKNITYLRYQFFTRSQQDGEKIDPFVTDLKNKARECEFGELEQSLIKDRLICGIRDDTVRRRLLRESDLTLVKAIDACRSNEATAEQMQHLNQDLPKGASAVPVHAVDFECNKCGGVHKPRQCPAYGRNCHRCNKLNHYAHKCPNKSQISASAAESGGKLNSGQQQTSKSQGGTRPKTRSTGTSRNGKRRYKKRQDVHIVDEEVDSSPSSEMSDLYIGLVTEEQRL